MTTTWRPSLHRTRSIRSDLVAAVAHLVRARLAAHTRWAKTLTQAEHPRTCLTVTPLDLLQRPAVAARVGEDADPGLARARLARMGMWPIRPPRSRASAAGHWLETVVDVVRGTHSDSV